METLIDALIKELKRYKETQVKPSLPVRFVVEELNSGEKWNGRINIVGIIAEDESIVQINGSHLYPMKPDEVLSITGLEITEIFCKSGKVKFIGTYATGINIPRMIVQRSVTLYGVESAVENAIKNTIALSLRRPVCIVDDALGRVAFDTPLAWRYVNASSNTSGVDFRASTFLYPVKVFYVRCSDECAADCYGSFNDADWQYLCSMIVPPGGGYALKLVQTAYSHLRIVVHETNIDIAVALGGMR